jgi:glycosyltransferase involved in cell wall biosynthesis
MRLGIIARSDETGLGNQTRNLTYMLKPTKVMLIDSTSFNGNTQYPQKYAGFFAERVRGFPNTRQIRGWLRGLDAVLTCETFYHSYFVNFARHAGVKTFLQYNYEFLDNLRDPRLPLPDVLLAPSKWRFDEMVRRFPNVVYLPPPTDERLFKSARDVNFSRAGRTRRYLHIAGRVAVHDRNGTDTLINSLRLSHAEFELVIKSQTPLKPIADRRVRVDYNCPRDEAELYSDFDALVLPRRYGGLCLPMNEALVSGLPVIMTDVSPNNKVLPAEWLVPTRYYGEFMARTPIKMYEAEETALAAKLDAWAINDIEPLKAEALELGYNNYSYNALRQAYQEVLTT